MPFSGILIGFGSIMGDHFQVQSASNLPDTLKISWESGIFSVQKERNPTREIRWELHRKHNRRIFLLFRYLYHVFSAHYYFWYLNCNTCFRSIVKRNYHQLSYTEKNISGYWIGSFTGTVVVRENGISGEIPKISGATVPRIWMVISPFVIASIPAARASDDLTVTGMDISFIPGLILYPPPSPWPMMTQSFPCW